MPRIRGVGNPVRRPRPEPSPMTKIGKFKQALPPDPRFTETRFVVEATSAEQFFLWKEWNEKCEWIETRETFHVEIGHLGAGPEGATLPVCVNGTWAVINGHRILFYHCCSLVTHLDWAREWAMEACGNPKWDKGIRPAHTDAMNFAHAIESTDPNR